MAAHLENSVLDAALDVIRTNAGKVTLCGTEPTNATEANSTYALASATNGAGFTAPLFGAVGARAPNGRQIQSATVAAAAVSGTGTANWVAYLNSGGTTLYAVLSMTAQALTSGNTWGMGASTIGIPAQ